MPSEGRRFPDGLYLCHDEIGLLKNPFFFLLAF